MTASLSSLTPSTTYHVQLRVTTPDGTVVSPDATFTTAAATVVVVDGGIVPPPVKCIVPRLRGLTLAKVNAALTRAHCSLGRMRHLSPKRRKRWVVSRQTPGAGQVLPAGTRVTVTLAPPRPKHRARRK